MLTEQFAAKEKEIVAREEAIVNDTKALRDHHTQSMDSLVNTLKALAVKARRETELELQRKRQSIGRIVTIGDKQHFEEGELFKDLYQKEADMTVLRDQLENERKRIDSEKRSAAAKKRKTTKDTGGASMAVDGDNFLVPQAPCGAQPLTDQDVQLLVQSEVNQTRLLNVTRELQSLERQKIELELQRKQLIKAEKLFLDELSSSFAADYLHKKIVSSVTGTEYFCLNLLGKGGFSEVYRAFDLNTVRAVKWGMRGGGGGGDASGAFVM